MNYWELRKEIAQIIPRMTQLKLSNADEAMVKEKGRKSNYYQYSLKSKEMIKQERLLNEQEVNSFVEISCRAAACPMPLNIDVWDGLVCPFKCIYCFANAFRASLYTAFFDNSKTMGFRHCNADYYKQEMDKLLKNRSKDPHSIKGDVPKAIAMEIPLRFGIRFEDFLYEERSRKISLELLDYLADEAYPLMINTKSELVGEDNYLESLSRNPSKTAIHITMISNNDELLQKIEAGAPPFEKRLEAARNLINAGVRVVARIEPFLLFINDKQDEVERYMTQIWDAGIRHITFDTYSYTANNSGIRNSFINVGLDYDRMFLLGCDSQGLGSLLLGKFMEEFRKKGFSCSTFDMGNAPSNDQAICCEVGDWFDGGFNYGCTVMAARLIKDRGTKHTHWKDFEQYVNDNGGFLSESLRLEVKELWSGGGNSAYSHYWAQGLTAMGNDEDGIVWIYKSKDDFRTKLLENIL